MTGKYFLRRGAKKVPFREHTRKYEQRRDINPHEVLFDCDFEELEDD